MQPSSQPVNVILYIYDSFTTGIIPLPSSHCISSSLSVSFISPSSLHPAPFSLFQLSPLPILSSPILLSSHSSLLPFSPPPILTFCPFSLSFHFHSFSHYTSHHPMFSLILYFLLYNFLSFPTFLTLFELPSSQSPLFPFFPVPVLPFYLSVLFPFSPFSPPILIFLSILSFANFPPLLVLPSSLFF
jgi:hypothetical protein